jgi:hypothetical protein
MPPTSLPPEEVYLLIIRFTASIPDLPLTITAPSITTTLALKQLIRSHIPAPHSSNRLRLIHAGKVLEDASTLSKSLKLIPPPPRSSHASGSRVGTATESKGKAPVYDVGGSKEPIEMRRIWIHCSVGDPLTDEQLKSEAEKAAELEANLLRTTVTDRVPTSPTTGARKSQDATQQSTTGDGGDGRRSSVTTTSSMPQGFDRLLGAGFTAAEVAQLRSQFMANVAFTHTPDTMPNTATLRAMEDRWLDSSASDPAGGTLTSGGSGGGADDIGDVNGWQGPFQSDDGGLGEDLLWGLLTGFFWPIGALCWGLREEGVWSYRRMVAVGMGVGINALFGFVKWSA